jgi:hypothetical protein
LGFGIRPRARGRDRLADRGHHVGRRDRGVEVDRPLDDLLDELLAAHDVGPGLGRLARLLTLSEHGDADALAGAVRQAHRPAQALVLLAGVQAQAERHLDGLVELRVGLSLQDPDRVARQVLVLAIERCLGRRGSLPGHDSTSTPMLRAVPATISIAASTSFAFRSGHLLLGDVTQLRGGERAHLVAVGDAGSLLDAGGLLDQLCHRRLLEDERERAVLVDREDGRDHLAAHLLGRVVVLLAELHDVHAVLPEGGANGGAGVACPARICSVTIAMTFFFGAMCDRFLPAVPAAGRPSRVVGVDVPRPSPPGRRPARPASPGRRC